jgi:hypothetical protein
LHQVEGVPERVLKRMFAPEREEETKGLEKTA